MHKLLERQLRKAFGPEWPSEARFDAFVRAVGAAYEQADKDRLLLERSLDLASSELLERHDRLERDLFEIRRLEVELRQAEKLRAIGQLAAGIAHEINTPIQFIGDSSYFIRDCLQALLEVCSSCRLALAEVEGSPEAAAQALAALRRLEEEVEFDYIVGELPKALARIDEGIARVTQIVRAMKEFGAPDQREKVLADINQCLNSTLTVARSELKHVADVEVELGDLPLIPCYQGDLNQVFLNLLVNAAHAIGGRPDPDRGRIRVRSRVVEQRVEVTVSDNGCGIAESNRARIFEPFFTTKGFGRGTGQGLAIARAIVVEKHSGSLTFETAVGVGTTFSVRLPITPPGV